MSTNATTGTTEVKFSRKDYRNAFWARFRAAVKALWTQLKEEAISEAQYVEQMRQLLAEAEDRFANLSRIAVEAEQHWSDAGTTAMNAWRRHAKLHRFFEEGILLDEDGVSRAVTEQDVTQAEIESTRAAEAASKLGDRAFAAVGDASVAEVLLKEARANLTNAVPDFRAKQSEEKAA